MSTEHKHKEKEPREAKCFSDERIRALTELGYKIHLLSGPSIKEMQNQSDGNLINTSDLDIDVRKRGKATQVAIKTDFSNDASIKDICDLKDVSIKFPSLRQAVEIENELGLFNGISILTRTRDEQHKDHYLTVGPRGKKGLHVRSLKPQDAIKQGVQFTPLIFPR